MTKQTKQMKIMEEWIKERNGVPAVVVGTDDLLRVKFDSLETDLKEITWAEFFKTFSSKGLTFLYEDSNEDSRFYKFIEGED